MAQVISQEALVSKDECLKVQTLMAQEFKEIKEILNRLPKQIMDEANDTFVRKDVYEANLRSLIEEVKCIKTDADDFKKIDSDRMFKIIQIGISIIITLGIAYIASK